MIPPTGQPVDRQHAADRLLDAVDRAGAPVCVGLDPVLDRLPAAVRAAFPDADEAASAAKAIGAFTDGIIDAVVEAAPCVKFQSACYERYGAPGVAALARGMARAADLGLVVILDAKRGDIGISADHYAEAAFGSGAVGWVTVNPYLGSDGLAPFHRDPGRGAFALVRTSNPGGDELQSLRLADGRTLCEAVAALIDKRGGSAIGDRGYSNLGAVVGATRPADAARLRALMPQTLFLVPGFGAQGGTAEDIRACFDAQRRGAIVTASRSVIYAFDDAAGVDWRTSVAAAARQFANQVNAALE